MNENLIRCGNCVSHGYETSGKLRPMCFDPGVVSKFGAKGERCLHKKANCTPLFDHCFVARTSITAATTTPREGGV